MSTALYVFLYLVADLSMGGPLKIGMGWLGKRNAAKKLEATTRAEHTRQLEASNVAARDKRLGLIERAVDQDDRTALAELDQVREDEENA